MGAKLSSCGQQRLLSDWADAQADLHLRWAHTLGDSYFNSSALIRLLTNISKLVLLRQVYRLYHVLHSFLQWNR